MTDTTQQLIADLVAQVKPVRRLRPPLMRAVAWLLSVAMIGSLLIAASVKLHHATYSPLDIEVWSMLATAVLGVTAAFHLSVPGHSRRWTWVPVLPLLLWIASSGESCYRNWDSATGGAHLPAESPHCFAFIVIVSVPLAALLLWMLRRARPIAPLPVAFTAGVGVAAAAAFLLQFFHPFDVTVMDLLAHLVAVALVVGVVAASHRKSLD